MTDNNEKDASKPVEGDTFECTSCGMKILITTGCSCDDGGPFFSCCDQQMEATGSNQ